MREPDLEKLRRITRSMLDESRPAYSLRSETLELKTIFETASAAVGKSEDIGTGETRTAAGVAISPAMASMCLDDFARTIQFIRGLNAAVLDLRKSVSDRPVRLLYAGCGPWATLATPLMSVFAPSELVFTLLDIHEPSTASAMSLITRLGISDRVEECTTIDAMEYMIDPDAPPDIVLIEMMRAALESEPQVGVAMHLCKQAPGALMIPREVRIDLVLINQSREFSFDESGDSDGHQRDRIHVGEVLLLNKTAADAWTKLQQDLPTISLQLPEFDADRYLPMLTTTVEIYGEYLLQDYDSGITGPKTLPMTGAAEPGRTIEFRYEIGASPGLRMRYV